jgi:hypothetical protein
MAVRADRVQHPGQQAVGTVLVSVLEVVLAAVLVFATVLDTVLLGVLVIAGVLESGPTRRAGVHALMVSRRPAAGRPDAAVAGVLRAPFSSHPARRRAKGEVFRAG